MLMRFLRVTRELPPFAFIGNALITIGAAPEPFTTGGPAEEFADPYAGCPLAIRLASVTTAPSGSSTLSVRLPPPAGKSSTLTSCPSSNSVCLPTAPHPGAPHLQSLPPSPPPSTAGRGETPPPAPPP